MTAVAVTTHYENQGHVTDYVPCFQVNEEVII